MLRTAGKQTQFKANQTQNKPNSLDAQMNVSLAITRNYNNEQRTMNNERLCKTNPIKPNFYEKIRKNLRVWCENLTLLRKNLRVWCEDLLYSRLIFPAFFAELAGLPPFCAAKTPFIR